MHEHARHTTRHDDPAGRMLTAAADSVFAQCERLIAEVGDSCYAGPSEVIRGGTMGKHLRHVLDHYAALFNGVEAGPIVYDRRERNVRMESDRLAALESIQTLRGRLATLRHGMETPVRVRVMVSGAGEETELSSTLGRELAFATHHAVHHQAMMRAIASEFGVSLHDNFGKAPSTIHHERVIAPGT